MTNRLLKLLLLTVSFLLKMIHIFRTTHFHDVACKESFKFYNLLVLALSECQLLELYFINQTNLKQKAANSKYVDLEIKFKNSYCACYTYLLFFLHHFKENLLITFLPFRPYISSMLNKNKHQSMAFSMKSLFWLKLVRENCNFNNK